MGSKNQIIFNCSSLSPLLRFVRERADVPVFPVDEAMADRAVETGLHIGVLATLENTLGPTSGLIPGRADLLGKEVKVEPVLCEGAFDALSRGDGKAHDDIIVECLESLRRRADVVVLAQASMARALERLPEDTTGVPVLTSPRLGVERLRDILHGRL